MRLTTDRISFYVFVFAAVLALFAFSTSLGRRWGVQSQSSLTAAPSDRPTTKATEATEAIKDPDGKIVAPRADFPSSSTDSGAKVAATADRVDLAEYLNGPAFGSTVTAGDDVFTSLTGSRLIVDVSHWGVNGFAMSRNAFGPGAASDSAGGGFVSPVVFLGGGVPSFEGNYRGALDASGLLLEEGAAAPFNGTGTIPLSLGFQGQNADIAQIIAELSQSHPAGDDDGTDNVGHSTSTTPVQHVPEPSSLLLVAMGIVGLGVTRRHTDHRQC